MLVKTSELTGAALDWAVAKCEGYECQFDDESTGPWLVPQDGYLHCEKPLSCYKPSTAWAQGGPIIERERIFIVAPYKSATSWKAYKMEDDQPGLACWLEDGPTPLIAAMRCYVASKLGDEVEIPEELAK